MLSPFAFVVAENSAKALHLPATLIQSRIDLLQNTYPPLSAWRARQVSPGQRSSAKVTMVQTQASPLVSFALGSRIPTLPPPRRRGSVAGVWRHSLGLLSGLLLSLCCQRHAVCDLKSTVTPPLMQKKQHKEDP